MRHPALLALASILLISACGGGGKDTSPPPTAVPVQPGPPASISIVSGDAQVASAGAMLPVKLSVLVKDASGTALSGISVQFTVDSGGGSLSTTSASTGSNGIAVGGDWTLGTVAGGAQVVSAKAGAAAVVKFHAQLLGPSTQTLFDKAPVATSGGTLRYTKAGDALDGVTITVPADAFATSTEWTVIADSTAKVTLPADFTQVGPMLVVTNAQGYARVNITLRMPMQIAANVAVAPFYYDASSGALEPIPLVDRTATSATLGTRHFSADLLALPRNATAASALRQGLAVGFGAVSIVWVATPKLKLIGAFTTTFRPAVDNWEFENLGDYVSPLGDCEGMSISAMYYHYFVKAAGGPALYHQFDLTLANKLDNVQGVRFAGSVQGDMSDHVDATVSQITTLIEQGVARGTNVEDLTSTWILLTIKLTGRPVLLALISPNAGHAVVAYGATSTGTHTDVSFSDPNFPTTGRTMAFESGTLAPVAMAPKMGGPNSSYPKAYALAVSSEVPLSQVSSRYHEFTQKKAGADRYPAQYKAEYYESLTDKWLTLPPTIRTTDEYLTIRHVCTSCPSKTVGGTTPDEQPIAIWDGAGVKQVSPTGDITNVQGTTAYYARLTAFTVTDPGTAGFLDAIPFNVIYLPFKMARREGPFRVGDTVTVTADAGSLATQGSTYTWTNDDGRAAVTTLTNTYTYTLTKIGLNNIAVTLKEIGGATVARATADLIVGVRVSISPVPLKASPGNALTLTAVVQGGIPAEIARNVSYFWIFVGPGQEVGEKTTGTSIVHTFPQVGTYTVDVYVSLGNVALGNSGSAPVVVKQYAGAWRLTSFTLLRETPVTSGLSPRELPGLATIKGYLDQVARTPSDGMIFLDDGDLWKEHAVYFQVSPPGLGANATYWVPYSFVTLLARDNSIQFSHYTTTGTLKTGSIDGEAYTGDLLVTLDNSIQAQKSATQMTGTLTIGPYAFGGERTYQFVATLVTP